MWLSRWQSTHLQLGSARHEEQAHSGEEGPSGRELWAFSTLPACTQEQYLWGRNAKRPGDSQEAAGYSESLCRAVHGADYEEICLHGEDCVWK